MIKKGQILTVLDNQIIPFDDEILKEIYNKNANERDLVFLAIDAYNYGVIKGKQIERAKKRLKKIC